ncbi:phage portal protein [Rhodococcus qingshengii]|uniref:phage portal protein n=1 Tax=Rhodococcus qingshengii TaxID=334542 RepID=UPI0029424A14|nr:phage portal protein [Rhodococcus qingshengii]WOI85985.1 phage portal protein [Rhodococcus qingshengii]
MAKRNLPIRIRVAKALIGRNNKAFIPHLRDMLGSDAINDINNYRTKSEALTANLGWAYAANDAIVKPVSRIELVLYRKQKDGDKEQIFDHPILDLLKRPNFALTGKQLRRLHYTYLNFTGESYILMMKGTEPFIPTKGQLPDSFHVLPAHLCDFELGQTYTESYVRFNNKQYPIASIMRDLNPDPQRPYFGQGVITAAATTIDTDEQMKGWNRRFFANNARPGLIFETDEEMSDDAYERWKKQFLDEHTGTDAAYKNLLVEGGRAHPYMVNQQDLDFLNSRKFTRDEIFAMFQTSPAVVGMIENANRSIMDGAIYTHTILNTIPRAEDFVELLNTSFVQICDPTLEVGYINPVAEDKKAKLNEVQQGVNKWLTIDEARAQYGMDPLPNDLGTQIYAQGSLRPLDSLADPVTPPPETAAPDEGKKSFPKRAA